MRKLNIIEICRFSEIREPGGVVAVALSENKTLFFVSLCKREDLYSLFSCR
jgi:hypothetical protein